MGRSSPCAGCIPTQRKLHCGISPPLCTDTATGSTSSKKSSAHCSNCLHINELQLKPRSNWFLPQTGEGQAAPRPESSLRGGQGRLRQGGLALGGGWGLAGLADLEPQNTDKVVNVKGNGLDKAVQHILR